ncbi:glycosyltransferase [Rhodococcus hoagii]|nr:glycosyltransferase [Prescottella equi]
MIDQHENDDIEWSIVTVTFNNEKTLRRWMQPPCSPNVEHIVVDNASGDNTVSTAEELGATKVITLSKNVGFSAANNIGFQSARGRYVAFVNPDVAVDFKTLDRLRETIDCSGGLVAPQLLNEDGTMQPNARGLPYLSSKIFGRVSNNHAKRSNYYRYAAADEVVQIPWVIGAAVCGKREIFEQLGAWDSRFFLYYEDADLCLRAGQAGLPVSVDGAVHWTHEWKRATTNFKWSPWKNEIKSAARFYSRYPDLVFPMGFRRPLRRDPVARV